MNQENKSVEELAKDYADNKVPNPSPNDAPYYTAGDRWDDIYQTYKDAFAAASPKGKEERMFTLEAIDEILLAKAKELNLYVDFSDKTYDGDKEAPMDRIGLLVYILQL